MLFKFLTKRKIILFIAGLFLFFFVLVKPTQAFSPDVASYKLLFEQAVFGTDEMNLQSFVNEVFKSVTEASLIYPAVGCIGSSCQEGGGSSGVFGPATRLIAAMYTSPPASGVQYLADLGRKIGVVPQPAYAQEGGIGFQAMESIMPIWTAFRNISYVFFVLIFVFVGFAIMFRVKINPQTVVSIQSALPKIILALILVTFSYAIVGFMIDLMYVLLGLITHIFIGEAGIVNQLPGLIAPIVFKDMPSVGSSPGSMLFSTSIFFTNATLFAFVIAILLGPFSILIAVVAVVLALIAIIRCGWTLLKTYAMIIIQLITAPFQILVGTLPGSGAIGGWFKNLLANVMVFPTMFLMFHLSAYLILAGIGEILGNNPAGILGKIILSWLGPVGLGLTSLVLPAEDTLQLFSEFILPIIGLVVLLMAPKAADMIKGFITQKPFEYGTAIGEAVGYPGRLAGYGISGMAAGAKVAEAWPKLRPFLTKKATTPKPIPKGGVPTPVAKAP